MKHTEPDGRRLEDCRAAEKEFLFPKGRQRASVEREPSGFVSTQAPGNDAKALRI